VSRRTIELVDIGIGTKGKRRFVEYLAKVYEIAKRFQWIFIVEVMTLGSCNT
jgi:hypothetical protein